MNADEWADQDWQAPHPNVTRQTMFGRKVWWVACPIMPTAAGYFHDLEAALTHDEKVNRDRTSE